MDFILATNNMKKLAEMQRILSPLGINVVTAKMLGIQSVSYTHLTLPTIA